MRLTARKISAGYGHGEALVSKTRFSMIGGLNPATGEIYEVDSPLRGRNVSGKVLVIVSTRGSAAQDKILLLASREGVAPAAVIFAEVDPVAALGCIVGQIPAVTDLEMDPFEAIENGDWVQVDADRGFVEIKKIGKQE